MALTPLPPRLSPDGPRFLAIARALSDDIRRGVHVAGARLPSSRVLARDLGVHRNTVLAALAELEAQGWITTAPARGTFVSAALPAASAPTRAPRSGVGFALPPVPITARAFWPRRRGVIALDGGVPDPRGFPVDALARAWRRVVRRHAGTLLSYGRPRAIPRCARRWPRWCARCARCRPPPTTCW
jgi:GntR family transcriptional regulator/MocR family aminotransferase